MRRLGWTGAVSGMLLLAAVVGLGVVLLQERTQSTPTGLPVGSRMPPFAAPLVRSSLDGDANITPADGAKRAGVRPACEVRGRQVLNGCALVRRGPVVLAFVAPVGTCLDELRALDALQRAEPRLQVAAVVVAGERAELRRELKRRRVTIPVGWDRDGALSAVYRVAVCPQTTLADRGGVVRDTVYGAASSSELRRRAGRLRARP